MVKRKIKSSAQKVFEDIRMYLAARGVTWQRVWRNSPNSMKLDTLRCAASRKALVGFIENNWGAVVTVEARRGSWGESRNQCHLYVHMLPEFRVPDARQSRVGTYGKGGVK